MTCAARQAAAVVAIASSALFLAACSHQGGHPDAHHSAPVKIVPDRILSGPKGLKAATGPPRHGVIWTLAGEPTTGLFELDSASGRLMRSFSVSNDARSVAESSAEVIGLALGTDRSGALELLDGRTRKPIRTIALPAPAREVVAGNDGTDFYVLTEWPTSASVTIVNSSTGKIVGTVPVPLAAVSAVPDVQQNALYVLQKNGLVDEVSIPAGKITAQFKVGEAGRSIALSPDGMTLYVLKGTAKVSNVAIVDVSTESVRKVLPAPSNCLEVLVSASGTQLYEVVGTPGYGNIQVFRI